MKRTIIAAILMIALAMTGCSQDEQSVKGKWQSAITQEITIEFKEDGVLNEYLEDKLNTSYSYKQDGNSVTVDQSVEVFTLTMEDDKLLYNGEILYTRQ